MYGLLILVLALVSVSFAGYTQAEITTILNQHNKDRARFASAPLVWDAKLASVAQAYADRCVYQHNSNRKADAVRAGAVTDSGSVGENIAYRASSRAVPIGEADYTQWADEDPDWSCSATRPYSERCRAGAVCGHWTQIIWNTTTRLGCGKTQCGTRNSPAGSMNWHFIVCNYANAGNWGGAPAVSCCSNCGGARPVAQPVAQPVTVPRAQPVAQPTPRAQPVAQPVAGGAGYRNCYDDPSTSHLSGWRQWFSSSGSYEPSRCRSDCLGKGFSFFGLQKNTQWNYCVCYGGAAPTSWVALGPNHSKCNGASFKQGNGALAFYAA